MEMTPPISPNAAHENSRNILSEKGSCGFHCIGEAGKKTPLDPRGFLMSGDGSLSSSTFTNTSTKQSFVTVFSQEFDLDSVCHDDLSRLFRMSWNRLCLIESAQKSNFGSYGFNSSNTNLTAAVDLDAVRQELREFFFMLRMFVSIQSEDEENSWVLEEMFPTLTKGLSLLRSQLGWLTDLPSYVLSYSHAKNGSKSAACHLLHTHLELRWLHVTVLWTLASCMNATPNLEATQSASILQQYGSETTIQNLLQSTIRLCVVDLLEVAVSKFNKMNQETIVHSSLFNCMCVKELWLLLRFITESLQDNDPKAFWKLLDESLELVVKAGPENAPKKTWRSLKKPGQLACSEPGLFSLWVLRNIGELFMYGSDGALNPAGHEIDSGQGTVKRVLNNLTSSHDMDEPQRRTLICLIRSFMCDPWKPRPEPIMALWEGFSRKLDCAFQLPGAPASSFAIASDTVEDILASVDFDGGANKAKRKVNSFEMFLSLLATYLKQDPTQWKSKMCGRFYSKLSEKKVDGLSEMGLYHLTQLFLAIASQTDVEELVVRFQRLVRFSETDEKRNEMIMKAQLCFVSFFVREGKQLGPLAEPLSNAVDSLIARNQNPVVQIFIDNLRCIIKSTEMLPPDLYVIFGDWVKTFLQQNRQDSTTLRNLLNLMVDVMLKIQNYMDCNNIVGGGVEKLVTRLYENLLPYLKDHKCNDLDQISDLAVHFTLISLEFSSSFTKDTFESLVHHFMMSESNNIMLVRRYLHRILSSNKINNIIDANENLQILFIQAWVRCGTLSSTVDQDRDKAVAQRVTNMPVMKDFFNLPPDGFVNISDPLMYLIEVLGSTSTSNKKTFLMLLEPLNQLIPVLKSSLFPSKSKDTSWVPDKNTRLEKDVIVRAYLVLGKLTCDCASYIFEKNTSSNLLITLVNNLILHPNVFNMDVRLPLAMDEGLRKSLFLFLRGIIKIDPKKEKCLQRFITDIIKVYVPRFGVIPNQDPFTKIWDDPEHMAEATYIIKSVCEILIQVDKATNLPCKYYVQGLHLINELVTRNDCDEFLVGVLIDNVLPSCLYVVAKVTNQSASNRRPETERTLQLIFESEAYHTNPQLWEQSSDVLNQLSSKYLGFSAELFMRMLVFLVKDFKPIVKRFLPTLESNIREVISKRGSGKDKTLESLLAKLKSELLK